MEIDLGRFHEAFFEESLEALDHLEAGLLNIDLTAYDTESINSIFRAAHTIKGCSATFGFKDIAQYVHLVETVLDEIRSANLNITQSVIDLLLGSVDALRAMIKTAQNGSTESGDLVEQTRSQLKNLLEHSVLSEEIKYSNPEQFTSSPGSDSSSLESLISVWSINFAPKLDLLKTGNDPLRMFNALQQLGEISVNVNIIGLIPLSLFDPVECYLSWQITLRSNVSRQAIEQIFEWVEEDCEIATIAKQSGPKIQSIQNQVPLENEINTLQAEAAPAPSMTKPNKGQVNSSDASSIRVGIDKIDNIINIVGELVITQSMLTQLGQHINNEKDVISDLDKFKKGLGLLDRNTRDLQDSVMRIRMLPVSYIFNRVPRIVRDLSKNMDKHVELIIEGETTELDKTVLEKLSDPVMHLVRNALDHGIENSDTRISNGKPPVGTITLNAFHKGSNIVVEISDDGAGINKDKIVRKAIDIGVIKKETIINDEHINDLVFHPGISTVDTVDDKSRRGVGMDVVRKNICDLGGGIDIVSSQGLGTTFSIRLPLTLSILDGQLIRLGAEKYVIPLVSIVESHRLSKDRLNLVAGKGEVYNHFGQYITLVRLSRIFGSTTISQGEQGIVVVVESNGKRVGVLVDELLVQQQVVIKSLENIYRRIPGISGATILGDGSVALILDISGIVKSKNTISTEMNAA